MEEIKKSLGSVIITKEIATDIKKSVKNTADFGKKIKEYITQNTTNFLDVILFGAILIGASDIHIEPQDDKVRVRIRLDGVLQDVAFFSQEIYHNLLSRIKLLSKIGSITLHIA